MIPELLALAIQLAPAWKNPCPEATLLFAGDAMQHAAQIDEARRPDGTYDYSDCFTPLADYISSADYAVVNLETPVSQPPYSGYPCFNAPTAFAEALKDAGFDLFLTANNHTLDRRENGLRATIAILDSLEVDHIGTYVSERTRCDLLPLIKDINGFKVGFLNYTYGTNGFSPRDSSVVDYIDKGRIAADIASAREKGAEIICTTIHWGDEYVPLPNKAQRQIEEFLREQGVELIIGAHPHVVQPMQMHIDRINHFDRTLTVYSLGNFISNMKTTTTRGGAIVQVKLIRDITGKARILEASYLPVFTVPAKGGFNFHVINAFEAAPPHAEPMRQQYLNHLLPLLNKHNLNIAPDSTSIISNNN
ncbi:MAG: CapA family protein [Bacteroidales bacterium]|nr:CapA family protein [Bacteroidales bacterium]